MARKLSAADLLGQTNARLKDKLWRDLNSKGAAMSVQPTNIYDSLSKAERKAAAAKREREQERHADRELRRAAVDMALRARAGASIDPSALVGSAQTIEAYLRGKLERKNR